MNETQTREPSAGVRQWDQYGAVATAVVNRDSVTSEKLTGAPRPRIVPPVAATEEDESRFLALMESDQRRAAEIKEVADDVVDLTESLTKRVEAAETRAANAETALRDHIAACQWSSNDFKGKILHAITSTRFQALVVALLGTASLFLSGGIDGNAALVAVIGSVVAYIAGRSYTDARTPAPPVTRQLDVEIKQGT